MHPAPSVIVFTALSGIGFGMMIFLGFGQPAVTGWSAFIFYFIAFALSVGGLLSSTLHLGNPQRAMKAFKQWRSSWLSREGVVSVAALLVMGLYAFFAIFFEMRIMTLGVIGAFLSFATVYCTSMIYAQLKTVPRWNMVLTTYLFLLYSLAGGALMTGRIKIATGLLVLLAICQIAYWIMGDGRFKQAGSTIETATGLGNLGQVRLLESPHSGENYLLKEMVHQIGRKHSMKLRIIAFVFAALIPLVMLVLFEVGHGLGLIVVAAHLIGLFASRWLFFAEAEHVVGLYYDKR